MKLQVEVSGSQRKSQRGHTEMLTTTLQSHQETEERVALDLFFLH